ncbi:MAG: hypothetical protein CMM16_05635 [Rhodospirillaceae bacterium]|nr:hypothetical protein [Rhodospirillaceae bacterium]
MTEQNKEQEPSMEEILASIRRIISADGDEKKTAAAERQVIKPLAVAAPGEPELNEDAVLELTDEIQADGTVVNLNTGDQVSNFTISEEEVEIKLGAGAEESSEKESSEPEPSTLAFSQGVTASEPTPKSALEPENVSVEETVDRLISADAAMNSVASLSALAAAVDTRRRALDPSIGPRSIEDLVKDVMRPMVGEWLDDNLPSLVERMVAREIDRLSREAEDISQG